jgi:hypothetical protein
MVSQLAFLAEPILWSPTLTKKKEGWAPWGIGDRHLGKQKEVPNLSVGWRRIWDQESVDRSSPKRGEEKSQHSNPATSHHLALEKTHVAQEIQI